MTTAASRKVVTLVSASMQPLRPRLTSATMREPKAVDPAVVVLLANMIEAAMQREKASA